MKLILAALLALQATGSDCAAFVKFSGVGERAARQVRPYADCLNSTYGTPEKLTETCSVARGKVLANRRSRDVNLNVGRAVRWLDAMVRERAFCETRLIVGV